MKKDWTAIIDGRSMNNDEIIEAIIENRGIENLNEFLNPSTDNLIPYEELKNINQAWYKLDRAISNEKSILIYADVDVDGCTSGAIMYRYLKHFTKHLRITINDGKEHGIKHSDFTVKPDLVIIVDSIDKADIYHRLTEKGIEVIVLDHHILPSPVEEYSDISLVSSANDYANPQLSGAGVTWKFCKYCDEMWLTDYADKLIDLAATGIIADMCDISVPENRYICYTGLTNLCNTGIKNIVGSYEFNSQSVSFSIAPLINACNRMFCNDLAMNIFLEDDTEKVKDMIKDMKSVKEQQDEYVNKLMPSFAEQAENQINNKVMFFIINTEYGISGLVANKLMSIYQRPVFVVKDKEDMYMGSMRACGVDDFMTMVNETGLAKCDGHELASGFFCNKDNYDKFKKAINKKLEDIEFEEKIIADIQLDTTQINTQLINNFKSIDFLSGTGSKPLTVMITNINDYKYDTMSKGKHLKLITDNGLIIQWNTNTTENDFINNDKSVNSVNIIATLNSSRFGKTFWNQMIVQELRIGR